VYRTYLPDGAAHLRAATALAIGRRPDLGALIRRVEPLLLDPDHPAALRFQQTSGMVMAKGVEDRSFYRFNRLGSLTEVGGNPDEFAITVDEFHARQQRRLAAHPWSMTALTTHDTKRGEDVRARLDALSELGSSWSAFVDAAAPTDSVELLIWQSILGSWPASRSRLRDYALKAAREACRGTDWSAPNQAVETRLLALVDRGFDDPEVNRLVVVLVAALRQPGWSNALSAKLLQLCGPGVPDCYQGSELWEMSLVDPDNRRPVDFDLRRQALAELDRGGVVGVDATGRAKLLVVSRCLRARRDRPELFTSYRPLEGHGPAARHLVAFDRGGAVAVATRLPVGLAAAGGWEDTSITLPPGPRRDAFTGRLSEGGVSSVGTLLEHFPVALLLPEPPGDAR
jgi:(1->4)-alpha-D-glucan 1-alpha-D-glucosylmutase